MKEQLRLTENEQKWGWFWLGVHVLILPTALVMLLQLIGVEISMSLLNVATYCVTFVVTLIIFRRYLLVQLKSVNWMVLLWIAVGCVMYNLLMIGVRYLEQLLLPNHINANDIAVAALFWEHPVLLSIGTIILAPIFEEILYRGLVFGSLYRVHPVVGYIGNALIFATVHVIGYIGMQEWSSIGVSMILYLPAGVALSFAYERSGTLVTPIVIHTIINLLATLEMR